MTRKEMEMTLIPMMKGIEAFVKLFDQNINHINFYTIDGCLDFRAVHQEDGKEDTEILSCHVFDDGSMKIDGAYYNADGSINFIPVESGEEVSA
jgi:hypothetical protein